MVFIVSQVYYLSDNYFAKKTRLFTRLTLSLRIFIEECPELEGSPAVQVFSNYQHLPWAMLLDTCNNQLSDGRYDIIVHSPIAKLVVKNKELIESAIKGWTSLLKTESDIVNQCPFERLEAIHTKFKLMVTAPDASPLPFLCGALGYFNYDLNVQLDGIKDNNTEQYSSPDLAVGIYDQSLIFDNKTNKVYCCYIDAERAEQLKNDNPNKDQLDSQSNSEKFKQLSHWHANQTESEYRQKLQKVDDYLHSGDCYQINFAQRFEATYQGSEWQAYQLLRNVNKAPFSSFIRLENSCILSVSPERFLQVKGGMVETKPIKGTRKRAQNSEDDKKLSEELLSSEKDRAENLMIVDLLRNDLSKHCEPHSVVVPALFKLESYPAVHHMVSTILGKLKATSSPIQLLKGAFPGGSITGAPKHRAMQIIQELEPDKRSIYCGSIGYIGIRNDMDTSICIRTVLAENNQLYCWAGGGIVLDSDIASEYQESLDKVAKILPILEETMRVDELS
ncbi:MAG: para-aminobenzoate synthetase component 1 [Gammaproteobacteria bacterium]|jgi:para-aminobenzoate synthetase component 1